MKELLLVALIIFLAPGTVYWVVKLGTLAFYRGRQFFEEQQKGKK